MLLIIYSLLAADSESPNITFVFYADCESRTYIQGPVMLHKDYKILFTQAVMVWNPVVCWVQGILIIWMTLSELEELIFGGSAEKKCKPTLSFRLISINHTGTKKHSFILNYNLWWKEYSQFTFFSCEFKAVCSCPANLPHVIKGDIKRTAQRYVTGSAHCCKIISEQVSASISPVNEQQQSSRQITLLLPSSRVRERKRERKLSFSIHTTWTKDKLVPGWLSGGFLGAHSGGSSAEWLPRELHHHHQPRWDSSACLFK